MKQYYKAPLFFHTDLGQNAVFYNFAIQIALIQYSGRSKHAWAFSETVKNIPKSPNYSQPVLTFDKRQIWIARYQVFEWTLIELFFNIIKNALCLFFI